MTIILFILIILLGIFGGPSNYGVKISESTAVQMPMKTVASLIAIVAMGRWAYFGFHEKLNNTPQKN